MFSYKKYFLIIALISPSIVLACESDTCSNQNEQHNEFSLMQYLYDNVDGSKPECAGASYLGRVDAWSVSEEMIQRVIEVNNYKPVSGELRTTLLIIKQTKMTDHINKIRNNNN